VGGRGGGGEAQPLLARLDRLATDEPLGRAVLRPELQRWRAVFRLDP
jgi:hypothetical protein